jgi:hypothetical protein
LTLPTVSTIIHLRKLALRQDSSLK